jgi:dienelactone hydrolase
MLFRLMIILLISALVQWANLAVASEPPLVILMPGGSGIAKPTDFLVRNRRQFDRAGFETLVSSSPLMTVQAAKSAHARGRKVLIAGISLGVSRSASALAAGAPSDAAVFFSGAYQLAQSRLRSPKNLPPTLVVHHRHDGCPTTTPVNVEPFRRWSGGKVVKIVWIQTSGDNRNWICGPLGAHGFFQKDQEPMSAAIAFLKSH